MAANSTQALGVVMFLVAVALLAGALAAGGSISIVLILAGLVVLAYAISLFIRAKPLEKMEE